MVMHFPRGTLRNNELTCMICVHHLVDRGCLDGFPHPMELHWGLQSRGLACLCLATFLRTSSKWFPELSMWLPPRLPKENETPTAVKALWEGRKTDWHLWDCRKTHCIYFSIKSLHRTTDYNYNFEISSLWKNPEVGTGVKKDIKDFLSCQFQYMYPHSRPIKGTQ